MKTLVKETVEAVPTLTANDRCDSCGSRAYHKVTLKTGELYFCGHHGKKYESGLSALALAWLDESHTI